MKTYVINLARRKDRLDAMTAQLVRMDIGFERVPAVDSVAVREEWLARYFADAGPLGAIPKGDKCCSLSHRRAWAAFLASEEPYAVFLEDDVLLDPAAADFLTCSDWLPKDTAVVKLEHFGPQNQRVLLGNPVAVGSGWQMAPIHSRHTGAGAYILSRNAAAALLAHGKKWNIPVDHLLFNANVSEIAVRLRPYQLLPALARQHGGFGGVSDIASSRKGLRKPSWAYVKREAVRAWHELRLLPQQILKVLRGEARLLKVAGGPYDDWQTVQTTDPFTDEQSSDQLSLAKLLKRV